MGCAAPAPAAAHAQECGQKSPRKNFRKVPETLIKNIRYLYIYIYILVSLVRVSVVAAAAAYYAFADFCMFR